MRKILLYGLAIVLFTACDQKDTRYTQQSPEIDSVKKAIANYNSREYDLSIYADTCKTFFNTKSDPLEVDEIIAYHQANDANYSSRGFLEENQEYEMVVTDQGETWVNAWLDWQGTLKESGKVVNIPIHLTYRFIDGKIVRSLGFWDPTEVVLGLQEIEREKAMSTDQRMIKSTIDAIVRAWNANDQNGLKALMTDDFVRTENGKLVAESPQEYATDVISTLYSGFPDFKVSLTDYKVLGNKALITWRCTGTNTAEFQGEITNKPITTHGTSIWTIEKDGRASREEAYFDNLALFQQLGYSMPAPPKS